MWLLITVILMDLLCPIHTYRDGARNESCFDHYVNHSAQAIIHDCDVDPSSCPYFLRIHEVLDMEELTVNNTNTNEPASNITCGNHIYASEYMSLYISIIVCMELYTI